MVIYCLAHSSKIICIPQPIIPVRAPPQLVTFIWYGSANVIKVTYICYLNGRVPEAFELWVFEDDGVRKVHMYARVKFCSEFREDTFQTFFFNKDDSIIFS